MLPDFSRCQGGRPPRRGPRARLNPGALLAACALSPGCLITPWAFETAKVQDDDTGRPPEDAAPGGCAPSGPEVCDGIDNDCDGLIDDADGDLVVDPGFEDLDGDGFGAAPLESCDAIALGGDCDDLDPRRWPGAPETCGDGVINDCLPTGVRCAPTGGDLATASAWRRNNERGESLTGVVQVVELSGGPALLTARVSVAGSVLLDAAGADGAVFRTEVLRDRAITALPVQERGTAAPALPLCTDGGVEVVQLLSAGSGLETIGSASAPPFGAQCTPLLGERAGALWFGGVYADTGELQLWPADREGPGSFGVLDGDGIYIAAGVPLRGGSGFVGDLDADGLEELGLLYQDDQPFVLVYSGAETGARTPGEADATLWSDVKWDDFGLALRPAGDVNGDGYGDLWVSAASSTEEQLLDGAVRLFHGPLEGEHEAVGLAVATLWGGAPEGLLGLGFAGRGRDLNGDERADLVIGGVAEDRVGAFLGPVEGARTMDEADVLWSSDHGALAPVLLPDLDGDSVDDVVIIEALGGRLSFVPGLGF